MILKTTLRYAIPILGIVFAASVCIGLSGNIAIADSPDFDQCENNDEFTTYFRLADCEFQAAGINPYFILKPGYQLVLESEDEKSVETVLCETKWIKLNGRWIKTRVVEERAYELDGDEENLIEISRNYFAICEKTNAVYYFGEFSRDCPDGFNEKDECTGEESNEGSWEAGKNGAMPGLIMPGTPLMGAKYFQEIAVEDVAVDRGEILDVGFDKELESKTLTGCIEIEDTNPVEGVCAGDGDVKIYCPGVGLVQDQELELVWKGFVGCDGDHDDWRWKRRSHRR